MLLLSRGPISIKCTYTLSAGIVFAIRMRGRAGMRAMWYMGQTRNFKSTLGAMCTKRVCVCDWLTGVLELLVCDALLSACFVVCLSCTLYILYVFCVEHIRRTHTHSGSKKAHRNLETFFILCVQPRNAAFSKGNMQMKTYVSHCSLVSGERALSSLWFQWSWHVPAVY
jgi:hypothetical protein